ncbi:MAG: hypothetical protein ACRCYO_13465 [Bacteroidia bacterium]
MKDPKDHIPDHDLNEPEDRWSEQDQHALDDYNQAKEDLAQEE